MRCIYRLLFVGMVTVLSLSGCSATTIVITETPDIPMSTATGAATSVAAATVTPSSHPNATNTPSLSPTKTPTPAPTTENCGLITATTTGTTTTTIPSNPQSREDCFTDAFIHCQSATLAITYIDNTGKTAAGLRTPDPQGNCEVASVEETKFETNGSITSDMFTCSGLVAVGGGKYSLRSCTHNEFVNFP